MAGALLAMSATPAAADHDASYYSDLDGNGTTDLAWDSNSDGWVDAWCYDRDGNGAWDFGAADVSGNGWWDRYDLDSDGSFEAADQDEDGRLDLSLRPLPTSPPGGNYGAGNDYLGGVTIGGAMARAGCAWC